MKRRILTLLLTCRFLPPTSTLVAEDSAGSFVRTNTASGQFSDLPTDFAF